VIKLINQKISIRSIIDYFELSLDVDFYSSSMSTDEKLGLGPFGSEEKEKITIEEHDEYLTGFYGGYESLINGLEEVLELKEVLPTLSKEKKTAHFK